MSGEHFIIIDGNQIPCTIIEIDIFDLLYFSENPRIHYIISSSGPNTTQEDIEKEMWGVGSTKKLYRDILRNGGLLEEIIVKDRYVIEGNTRLCAYRKLYNTSERNKDEIGLTKWRKIRAKVLPSSVTDTQIFSFLGTLHVRGKTDWKPFEQASYVHRMKNILKKTATEIHNLIGISESDVKRYIMIYEVMITKFLSEDSGTDELDKFSYFDEYFKSREMQKLHADDPKLIDQFCRWVREERIYKAHQQVKDLADILQQKKARKIFLEEDVSNAFDEAKKKLLDEKPGKGDPFYRKLEDTRKLIRNAHLHEIKTDITDTPKKGDIIKKLHKELTRFCHNLGFNTKVHLQ